MKLSTLSILFSLSTLLFTCSDQKPAKTVRDVFDQETFDTSIIHRLYLYDSIKNILIANVDTIFNYRKQEKAYANDHDAVVIEPLSYSFSYMPDKGESADKISTKTLPPPIFSKIDSLCHLIGQNRIYAFTLERNIIRVNIFLRYSSDDETMAETQHTLTWNSGGHRAEKNSMVKDTVLANGWMYDIYTEKWNGR